MPPIGLQEIKAEISKLTSEEEMLDTYIEMSNRYLRNQPDSLLAVVAEIQKLESLDEDKREAFTSLLSANAWRLMNADSAIHYADKAAVMLRELQEHNSFLMMENLLAMQYDRQGEFLKAESLYLEAIDYREKLGDEVEYPLHFFYGNLGNLYSTIGAHDLAVQMFEKFLELEDNPGARCNILSKLGQSFMQLEDYEQAKEILSPCLEYSSLPPPIQSSTRSNLSTMHQLTGDSLQALTLMEDATAISSRYRIPTISHSQRVKLGHMYLDLDMIEKADSLVEMMAVSGASFSRPNEDIIKNEFLARYALTKGKYAESIEYADAALELADRHNLDNMLREVYSIKAQTHERLGEVDEALLNERLQRELDDERDKLRNDRMLAMTSVRYKLQNKEAELMSAASELESVKLRTFFIIIFFILGASYLFYRYRIYYLLKEEKTRNRLARDLHDDLSGTLSSISFFSEAVKRSKEEAGHAERFLGMIDKSASEAKEKIDDIIWAIDPSKDDWSVFLKKCKRFAADTLDSGNIEYDLEFADNFNTPVRLELRQNLWLIFKEMVNNLVQHSGADQVHIKFQEESGRIRLLVKDNGSGFDPGKETERNGLKNIRKRAEFINATVSLESEEGQGTRWELSVKG